MLCEYICYKLETFMDINFCGCFNSCVLLYLRNYGNYAIFFGYQRYARKYGNLYTARIYSVSNTFDPFAVSIMNDGEIVGHILQRISAACALFMQHHRLIRLTCRYTAI